MGCDSLEKTRHFVGKNTTSISVPWSTWNLKEPERQADSDRDGETERETDSERTHWHFCLPHCGLRCLSLTSGCRFISKVDSWAKTATQCWYLCLPRRPCSVKFLQELFSLCPSSPPNLKYLEGETGWPRRKIHCTFTGYVAQIIKTQCCLMCARLIYI